MTSAVYRDMGLAAIELVGVGASYLLLNWLIRLLTRWAGTAQVATRYSTQLMSGVRVAKIILGLAAGVCALAVVGVNAYWISQGQDALAALMGVMQQAPPAFWSRLGMGVGQSLGLVIACILVLRISLRFLERLFHWAKAYDQLRTNDESLDKLFADLHRILVVGLWAAVFGFIARFLLLPGRIAAVIFIGLRIYLIVSLGLLLVQTVAALVASLNELSGKYARTQRWLGIYEHLQSLVPLFRRTIEYIIYVSAATLVVMQVSFVARFADYGPGLVQVLGIFFLSRVAIELANLAIDRLLSGGEEDSEFQQQRRLTLVPLIKSLAKYTIFFLAGVLAMRALSLDPTPILAGAGLVTIVVGLGAQPIINDVVSGFFILFENLFLVGDYIEIGSARGVVEAIDIRTTRIRDPDGQQHILRNGQLGEIVNYSKNYTFAVVTVGVAYESDLDQVYRILQEVGRHLADDNRDVLQATVVAGLQDFGASELTIRTTTRVKPGRHLQIERDLRKLIKEAFDQEGIEIPFSQHVVAIKNFPEHAALISSVEP